jgi:hypothetical protein
VVRLRKACVDDLDVVSQQTLHWHVMVAGKVNYSLSLVTLMIVMPFLQPSNVMDQGRNA